MADPRAANCKAYADQGGMVTGVELQYVEVPAAKFQLINANLIDEQAAAGQTIAWYNVLDKNNVPLYSEKVYLAWPWPTLSDGKLLSGAPGQHMMSGLPYDLPNIGPGEIHIENEQGQLISDRIGGLGLPNRHHVSYQLTFKERGGVVPDPDGGDGCDLTPVLNELAELKAIVLEIRKHFTD